MPKPDEIVAARIAEELSRNGVVISEKQAALAAQLAEGMVSAEDWVRLVEQRQDKQREDGHAH